MTRWLTWWRHDPEADARITRAENAIRAAHEVLEAKAAEAERKLRDG